MYVYVHIYIYTVCIYTLYTPFFCDWKIIMAHESGYLPSQVSSSRGSGIQGLDDAKLGFPRKHRKIQCEQPDFFAEYVVFT